MIFKRYMKEAIKLEYDIGEVNQATCVNHDKLLLSFFFPNTIFIETMLSLIIKYLLKLCLLTE